MPREKEAYRDHLEHVCNFFGDKRMLSMTDVAKYTGREQRWCKKRFGIEKSKMISVVDLARKLCD